MKIKISNPAIRITLYYLIFGFIWILVSDRLLEWIIQDEIMIQKYQTWKGWFFILITGILFYFLASSQFQRLTKLTQSLNTNHRKLENLIANYPSGLVLINRNSHKISFLNEYARKIMIDWNVFIDSLIDFNGSAGKNAHQINPDIPERSRDLRFRNKDGYDVYLKLNTTPLKDDKGNNVEILITFDDISNHKTIEENLLKSEELHRILVRNLPDTNVYLFDKNLNLLNSIASMYSDIAGKNLQKVNSQFDNESWQILQPFFENAIKAKESSDSIFINDIHYRINTAALRDPDGSVSGGIAVIQVHNNS